ncbi:MAG TPA: diphosphate--fructose-6-phosphate 1-phosphotransferase [Candidatus Faecivivens stercoripullorum]|uniref:Pyrophosphate--fructose 6-phosphate 1-phosphotransferase n=1 Tax=Candidatus Faecivivens stercoripullorum TaxID=2840805 RepID=A0A9D1KSN8_9FIRM|nr:diphosphate--fructose-6-phosphate 1-phosphotransferase [Candidatus Faecivivens stercoripullorum]
MAATSPKTLLVGQSGGPSCAINATLAGVIHAASESKKVERILGSFHGIEGVLRDNTIDLTNFTELDKLSATPAMALGSCRFKLPADQNDPIYGKILERLEEWNVGWFLYIGGNDSMDTVSKLAAYFAEIRRQQPEREVPVVFGLPKTIDNDLPGCDHTPGYGSAARYLSVTMQELIRDTAIYALPSVTIVEIMGRNAGWLTLAAGLPKFMGGCKPDIVAIPEVPFDEDDFLDRIRELQKKEHTVIVAVSEGIRDKNGDYVGSSSKSGAVDVFGHAYLSGVGKYLEHLVKHKIGCKVRSIELNLMQRCSAHLASKTDLDESFSVGAYGTEQALNGVTGKMAVIRRGEENGEYKAVYDCEEIEKCANQELLVPEKWFDLENADAQKEICDYILPLIKGEAKKFTDPYGNYDYIDWLRFSTAEGDRPMAAL